ncbi:MAG TPA: phosphoribosyltransferase domain-containing protein [Fibrobacteria bacterium]|nr:phosphoribosyltransferase domain-containing protein [Fibrobacteria bacterium]
MSALAREIDLHGGILSVRVDRSDWNLDDLCGFASRNNPKRRFLFVSKVLGKHIPARPSVMSRAYADLADKIRQVGTEGPVVCLALCETATGLGEGVWEALVHSGTEALFLHSTRLELDAPLAFRFEEAHSHAVDHLLYQPDGVQAGERFDHARTLMLVDDEISTGRTMREIARAFLERDPALRRVVVVTLTDWVSEETWNELWKGFPLDVRRTSLLRGRYRFEPTTGFVLPPAEPSVPARPVARVPPLPGGPRRGILAPSTVPPAWLEGFGTPAAMPVLVLGTGEFHHVPFLLARTLEERGWDVRFQSTTRSPILTGHAIESVLAFGDHHGEGIPNFLYNVRPGQYHQVAIGYEVAGDLPASHGLPGMLGARVLGLAAP